jgi:hypothetical protein
MAGIPRSRRRPMTVSTISPVNGSPTMTCAPGSCHDPEKHGNAPRCRADKALLVAGIHRDLHQGRVQQAR